MGFEDGDNSPKVENTGALESIKRMAARYKDEVFTGVLHSDCADAFRTAHPEFDGVAEQDAGLEIGYVTNTGRFVNREEALQIALVADQVREEAIGRNPKLLSIHLKEGTIEE
jgi:hypothetical protein